MTCCELDVKLISQLQQHGTHVPVCIETMDPTGDGLELEESYKEVESVESIITPSGRRVIVLRV
jgi:hypothetical protein